MGGKKLLIMCMFLFLVLGINTIYASDINDTQTINAAAESDEIDKLSVSGDNDKLSVNDYTFQNTKSLLPRSMKILHYDPICRDFALKRQFPHRQN